MSNTDKSIAEVGYRPRQVNHLSRHPKVASKTLMRRSVAKPIISQKHARPKTTHSIGYHEIISLEPKRTVNLSRLEQAKKINRSQFVSHFAKPDARAFRETPQPIKAVLSKPKVEADRSIDELLHKAMEQLDTEIDHLEQIPIRRLKRFADSLVSNRFNGIALD